MPVSVLYLTVLLVVILVGFLVFKRPVYEAIFYAFIVLIFVSKSWHLIPLYIDDAMSTSLMYTMIVFVAMSQLLAETNVIEGCVNVIIAIFGRITGGAGYACIIASGFMGALSGSGPGNAMATGTFTVPPMLKSKFPPELAANVIGKAVIIR